MTHGLHIIEGAYVAAIFKHGDRIAERKNLLHAVRNINNHAPFLTQFADDAKQMVDLARRKRAGRFIKCDNLCVTGERLGNLNHLPLADGEVFQRRFRVDIQPQMFQLQPRFVVEQRAVH